MASRYMRGALGRRASEPVYISDSEDYSVEEEDIVSEEQNNRRLRQAISYLATEGGSDSLGVYANRVQKIDDHILQQYAEEGYSFDSKLYRQLRHMVREVQTDFDRDEELLDSEDIEEVEEAALYRDDSDAGKTSLEDFEEFSDDEVRFKPAVAEAIREGKRPVRQEPTTRSQPARQAVPAAAPLSAPHIHPARRSRGKDNVLREIMWRYGGSNNDPEEYHRNYPASLPFGETLYMQEWESMKIDYDLQQSGKKKPGEDPVVTNVPYESVQVKTNNTFESGSRFKLPEGDPAVLETENTENLLKAAVNEFNRGGLEEHELKKDYAPRIWLPKILLHKSSSAATSRPRSAPSVSVRPGSAGSRSIGAAKNTFADLPQGSTPSRPSSGQHKSSVASVSPGGKTRHQSIGRNPASPTVQIRTSPIAKRTSLSSLSPQKRYMDDEASLANRGPGRPPKRKLSAGSKRYRPEKNVHFAPEDEPDVDEAEAQALREELGIDDVEARAWVEEIYAYPGGPRKDVRNSKLTAELGHPIGNKMKAQKQNEAKTEEGRKMQAEVAKEKERMDQGFASKANRKPTSSELIAADRERGAEARRKGKSAVKKTPAKKTAVPKSAAVQKPRGRPAKSSSLKKPKSPTSPRSPKSPMHTRSGRRFEKDFS